jgi:hypothetical protein
VFFIAQGPTSIVSYLHEWGTTAMFELGTAGDVLANEMGEEIWDVEVFHAYDHYSQNKNRLFQSLSSRPKTALKKGA